MRIAHLLFLLVLILPKALIADDRIKLGLIIPLTGPLAEFGVAIQNGIKLARDDNPKIDQEIEIIAEDTKYDAKTAVALFKKFRNQSVDLVYAWGGPVTDAVAPLAKQYRVPTIGWSIDSRLSKNNDYFIRIINPARDFTCKLNDYLFKKKYHRLGIIYVENQYINAMTEGLKKCLKPEQSLEVIDSFLATENNFNSTVVKIKQKEIDALGVFMFPGQVSLFYNQLTKQGYNLPTFGTDVFESLSEVKQSGPAMNGAVFTNHSTSEDFRNKYIKEFGNDYQIPNASLAYDLVSILYQISQTAYTNDINKSLREIKSFPGKSGTIRFVQESNHDAYFQVPIALRQVSKQQIHTLN